MNNTSKSTHQVFSCSSFSVSAENEGLISSVKSSDLKTAMENIKHAIIITTISGDLSSDAGEMDFEHLLALGTVFKMTFVRNSDSAHFSMDENSGWTNIGENGEETYFQFDFATGLPVDENGSLIEGRFSDI